MRRTLRLIGGACALFSAALAVPSLAMAADVVQPYASMRTLQTLQEQIAQGNATAQLAQTKLMIHIAEGFVAADPEVWNDPRNVRAAVLFVLSGGKPEVVRTVLAQVKVTAAMDRLVKGALAYGEGEEEIARTLLEPTDPRSLPNDLGGHLALVKAGLAANKDAAKADKLLDVARLLMPGTLVEEAALRRQIFLLAADGATTDKVTLLSRQYLHRFRNSVYAENFRQRFAVAALKLAATGDVGQTAKLDSVVREMRPDESRRFYLAMAQAAITNGKTAVAQYAAQKAAALAKDGTPDQARATLYSAAAQVVSDAVDDGMTRLSSIDATRLSPDDASLRQAALSVGTIVGSDNKSDGVSGDRGLAPTDPSETLIGHARTALADTDQLLKDGKP